jgi:hypothetical protein
MKTNLHEFRALVTLRDTLMPKLLGGGIVKLFPTT